MPSITSAGVRSRPLRPEKTASASDRWLTRAYPGSKSLRHAATVQAPVESLCRWSRISAGLAADAEETVLLPSAITATPGMIREAVGTLGPLPALTLDVGTED
jgi:hypothetical protein